jgi:hypothetical protein
MALPAQRCADKSSQPCTMISLFGHLENLRRKTKSIAAKRLTGLAPIAGGSP